MTRPSPHSVLAGANRRSWALEQQRLVVIKGTLDQVRAVLQAAKAARWYQVEMAVNKAVDLRLAAEIPLAR